MKVKLLAMCIWGAYVNKVTKFNAEVQPNPLIWYSRKADDERQIPNDFIQWAYYDYV